MVSRKQPRPSTPVTSSTESPKSVEQTIATAWQLLTEGKAREAETLCATLVKRIPEHAHGWFIRGVAAGALGKPKVALKHFDQVKDSPDLIPSVAQAKGKAFIMLEEFEQALDHFQQALMFKPDDGTCLYLVGFCYLRLGQANEAKRFFRQAVMLEPELGPAHFELGNLMLQNGNAAKALNHFQTAAQTLPDSAEVCNNLGLCQQALNQAQQAEASFRQALKLNPDYAEAWYNLGNLLQHQGTDEAIATLEQAFKLNPMLRRLQAHDK
jgi:tetratricopeptide (TPR) repeat protein